MAARNNAFVLRTVGLVVVLVAGCGGRHTAAGSVPSGTWQGVITGRELATAAGVMPQTVTLEIGDGAWTAETSAGNAAGSVITTTGTDVQLEGAFMKDSPQAGARAHYVLRAVRQGFLGGAARSYFLGHGVHGWILLDQVE